MQFSFDVSEVSTEYPKPAVGDHKAIVSSVEFLPNKAQTGTNCVITFELLAGAPSATDQELPDDYTLPIFLPLQAKEGAKDPQGYLRRLKQTVTEINGVEPNVIDEATLLDLAQKPVTLTINHVADTREGATGTQANIKKIAPRVD